MWLFCPGGVDRFYLDRQRDCAAAPNGTLGELPWLLAVGGNKAGMAAEVVTTPEHRQRGPSGALVRSTVEPRPRQRGASLPLIPLSGGTPLPGDVPAACERQSATGPAQWQSRRRRAGCNEVDSGDRVGPPSTDCSARFPCRGAAVAALLERLLGSGCLSPTDADRQVVGIERLFGQTSGDAVTDRFGGYRQTKWANSDSSSFENANGSTAFFT